MNGHVNLSRQYGCPATLTSASFMHKGMEHVARRFFRADMPETGRIEIYTIDHDGLEDFLRYATDVGGSQLDTAARLAVSFAASPREDMRARFALLEMV